MCISHDQSPSLTCFLRLQILQRFNNHIRSEAIKPAIPRHSRTSYAASSVCLCDPAGATDPQMPSTDAGCDRMRHLKRKLEGIPFVRCTLAEGHNHFLKLVVIGNVVQVLKYFDIYR